jgi:anaerobic ribonucleoside-triphosphate reductase activating protein
MNIASTQYSLNTQSFEIYLSGCKGCCKGCCNPELKDFNIGEKITHSLIKQIVNKVNLFNDIVNNIWILGGDPLDQNIINLVNLLFFLKQGTNKKIWIFTRYPIEQIDEMIKCLSDYIKCGEYLEELKCNDNIQFGIRLATSNQKIYKLNGGQIVNE